MPRNNEKQKWNLNLEATASLGAVSESESDLEVRFKPIAGLSESQIQ